MAKPKNLKKRSIPAAIFVVVAVAVLLFILTIFIYQAVRGSRTTNRQQCEIDSRNITAEYKANPLYEPPVACLLSIHEPDEPYNLGY